MWDGRDEGQGCLEQRGDEAEKGEHESNLKKEPAFGYGRKTFHQSSSGKRSGSLNQTLQHASCYCLL